MWDFGILRFLNNTICYRTLGKGEPIKLLDNRQAIIADTNSLLEIIKGSPSSYLSTFFLVETLFLTMQCRRINLHILAIMMQKECKNNT